MPQSYDLSQLTMLEVEASALPPGTVMMSVYTEKPCIVIGMEQGSTVTCDVMWADGRVSPGWTFDLHGLD